jgi:hypothetical protein
MSGGEQRGRRRGLIRPLEFESTLTTFPHRLSGMARPFGLLFRSGSSSQREF